MKVQLAPGERVYVEFEDNEGFILVEYDFNNSSKIRVVSDLPDEEGRDGEIYCEGLDDEEDIEHFFSEENGHTPLVLKDEPFLNNCPLPPIEEIDPSQVVVKILKCKCGSDFNITQGELDFMKKTFGDKAREPTRCKPCRALKKSMNGGGK